MNAEGATPVAAAEEASPARSAGSSPDSGDITASITELQNVLLGTESIEEFVHELAVQAASLVAGSLSCGVTIRRASEAATVACSDDLAAQVNELHYRLGEGPCLTALEDGCLVRSADLATEARWPRFAAEARQAGISSCLSLPLVARDDTVGALNLYSRQRQAFGPAQARRAQRFADNAASALALGLQLASYAALTDQLRASLASRAAIDQALGIIMVRQRCTQDTAFAALRAASQNRNVKLHDVAVEVVATVTGQVPQPPPFGRG
ncbi:MAG TPA: GAF and ANTAR domain-containing protein [Streptosporangiaceae bacterium]|jgi:transcriptional regulator with GAF, ATPase, and Fis domain